MVQADDNFNGRELNLQVGETLEISLAENASTGYRWAVTPESADRFANILHRGKAAAEGEGIPPGKPGVRRFFLEALEPGTADVELEYRRPWETGKPAARAFKLRVRVRPAPPG
jgi:inhibitor of cysteine peptidase